jgi:hypothetical protein
MGQAGEAKHGQGEDEAKAKAGVMIHGGDGFRLRTNFSISVVIT